MDDILVRCFDCVSFKRNHFLHQTSPARGQDLPLTTSPIKCGLPVPVIEGQGFDGREKYLRILLSWSHGIVMTLLNYGIAWGAVSIVYLYNQFHTHGFAYMKIDKGILRGTNASTWNGTRYFSFKGIPYAKPPIGELRFKGPREEMAWNGVRDALSHGPVCPQVDPVSYLFRGNEDCLYVNVYTPFLRDERLPVMFYVHGGKFMLFSGNDELWSPDYFMEAGVVVVTINYRLGPLGYLSTENDDAPGNAGMKDQVAALRWVRRNIAKFGGDPEKVTIFGSSTGAACVHYLVLSPMASGLFIGAIANSGSAVNLWALAENPASVTIRLAKAMGAKDIDRDKSKALKFLKSAPVKDMTLIQEAIITPAERRLRKDLLFVPSVERGVKSEEVFLPDSPINILKSGNFNKVPFVTGYTRREGYVYMPELETPEAIKAAFADTEGYVPRDIKNKRLRKYLGKSIREFYFDDKPIGDKNITNLVNLYSDIIFVTGVNRAARLHLQSSNSPIYFFVFSYDGQLNFLKFSLGIDRPGAAHGDELGYLFYHRMMFWRKPSIGSEDEYVSKTMIRLWTNFAKYGNPTPPGDPLTWEPATIDQFKYLNISGWDTRLGVNPDPERTDFWAIAYKQDEALRNRDPPTVD